MANKYELISKLAEETAKKVVKTGRHGNSIWIQQHGFINTRFRSSF